jgi:hypothetical protein
VHRLNYSTGFLPVRIPAPILADYQRYIEPLQTDDRYLASPLVDEPDGDLLVRSWRWWYNARGIIEMENRLDAAATAVVIVHPWGIDDGHGLKTPDPAGVSFFCTYTKNQVALAHMRDVIDPFLAKIREHVSIVGYSLPGTEDPIRKLLYASIHTRPEALDVEEGERQLGRTLDAWSFSGDAIPSTFELDSRHPVSSYFAHAPSTHTCHGYDGDFRTHLPMPLSVGIQHAPDDLVFYDGEGYEPVRDFLRARGIRHILLAGYATDMCVISTTCGYKNLSRDFNLFLVGDATMATFPGSTTPRFATQTAIANAALTQLVTQVSWIHPG